MRGLDKVGGEIVIGEDGTTDRSNANGLPEDTHLFEHFGDEAVQPGQ
jgi:hypothetical protein